MMIDDFASNEAVAKELGDRLRQARIDYPLTQAQLARRAGVSQRTVVNLERGAEVTTGSLVSVLRALGLLSRMELLVPAREPGPLELLSETSRRQRARAPRKTDMETSWKWGDEQ